MPIPCAVHGATDAVTRCSACNTAMCEACFRFLIAERPACVLCARELSTRQRRRVSLGVFTVLVSLAGAWLLRTRAGYGATLAVCFALSGLLSGLYLMLRRPKREKAGPVRARGAHELPTEPLERVEPHVRRARARRLLAALGPSLSGRATALSVLAAMALTALSLPKSLHVQRWLELSLVLLSWWLMGVVGLSIVLYRGLRVDDDHTFYAPANPLADGREKSASSERGCSADPSCLDASCSPSGCDDFLPLLMTCLLVLVALIAPGLIAWLLVEVALPVAFLGFYTTLVAALRRATHDRHDCRDDAPTAILWGAIWSTLYIAPLSLLLFVMHALSARAG